MITRLPLACHGCGQSQEVRLHLEDNGPQWTCPQCGYEHDGVLQAAKTQKLLLYAHQEIYTHGDYSMGIILSAMALDCGIRHQFGLWTKIKALNDGDLQRSIELHLDGEKIDDLLRRLGSVAKKIEAVGFLLDDRGIDGFAAASPVWITEIAKFSELHVGSLPEDFQRAVFWPRNKILHTGYAAHTKVQAQKVHKIATLGVNLLGAMQETKRPVMWGN